MDWGCHWLTIKRLTVENIVDQLSMSVCWLVNLHTDTVSAKGFAKALLEHAKGSSVWEDFLPERLQSQM